MSAYDTTGDGVSDFEIQYNTRSAFEDNDEDFQIHIYVAMRNGRKCTSTIQGLHLIPFPDSVFEGIDYKKILKRMRKKFQCNGNIKKDPETGAAVITLTGNQTRGIKTWLTEHEMCKMKQIVVHGDTE
eukprot:g2974.t1